MIRFVIGAGFGDEGKGQTVANLIETYSTDFVVRFNGGHQAGHTVVHNGVRHVFSSFGAGTLHGTPTYWANRCTVYPTALMNEWYKLKDLGVEPILYIDPMCPVTLPLDVEIDREHSEYGMTCGAGHGETWQRHENNFKIYAADLQNSEVLMNKLLMIQEAYGTMDSSEIQRFMEDVHEINHIEGIQIKRPRLEGDIIFEGAQGVLLDKDLGFFPYVTRSKTTPRGGYYILRNFNIEREMRQIYFVSRAYHTRHGSGPFTAGERSIDLRDDIEETNVDNAYQGRFRTAPLNLNLLKYSISMAMNEVSYYPECRIVFTCREHHTQENYLVSLDNKFVRIKDIDIPEFFNGNLEEGL